MLRRPLLFLTAVIALAMPLVLQGSPKGEAQAPPTLRIDPPAQEVASNATFTVNITSSSSFAPTGAQTDFQFDPSLLKIVSVEPGDPFAGATFLVGVAPQTTEEAIAEANNSGLLRNVAVFVLPGTGGGASSGDNVAVKISMQAKGFGGTSPLKLTGIVQMLDENGGCYGCAANADPPPLGGVSVTDGNVTVTGGGAPPPPGLTPEATPSPAGTPTIALATIPPSSGEATQVSTVLSGTSRDDISGTTLRLEPQGLEVDKGESFTIELKSASDVPISSVQVELKFNQEALDLEGIEAGEKWSDATGADESSLETVVEQGNETGSVEASFQLGTGESAPAGDDTIMTLSMTAGDVDAMADLEFVSVQMTDANGSPVEATFEDGLIKVGSGGATRSSLLTWTLVALLLAAVAGTGYGAYYMVRRRQRQWSV